MEKLLTIGIPTYNGSKFIGATLDSILSQIDSPYESQVEILVSNNASTDNTIEIVHHYQTVFPNLISCTTNSSNIGYDANVINIFEKASGRFVWVFGDDDTLKPGAILKVLSTISHYQNLGAILINFDHFDRDMKTLIHETHFPSDVYCHDANTFVLNAKGKYAFVSALIFLKDAWNRSNMLPDIGSEFIHTLALFKIIAAYESYIIADPLINFRSGSQTSTANGDIRIKIALAGEKVLRSMKTMGLPTSTLTPIIKDSLRYTNKSIQVAKLSGICDRKTHLLKLIKLRKWPWLWLNPASTILLPMPIFKIIYSIKKEVKQRTKFIEIHLKQLNQRLVK